MTDMPSAANEANPEPVYWCETCGKPIHDGDIGFVDGECIAFCEQHSPTLSDQIAFLADDLTAEEPMWPEWFETIEEAEADLSRLRAELAETGDRSLARPL